MLWFSCHSRIKVLDCCGWHAEISASIRNDMRWIGGITAFKTLDWPSSVIDSVDRGISLLSCISSEVALWGSRLPTRKMPLPKFYIWMNNSSWSGLKKVLGLKWSQGGAPIFSSSLAEVVFWYTGFVVSLKMILMKWDRCRNPDEDENLNTTPIHQVAQNERLRATFCLDLQFGTYKLLIQPLIMISTLSVCLVSCTWIY